MLHQGRAFCKRITCRSQRSGAVLVIVVVALICLLACAALTIDIGMIMMQRSRLQGYCDAAALAGAAALPDTTAAQSAAAMYYQRNFAQSDTAPSGQSGTYTVGRSTLVVTTPYSSSYTNSMSWSPANLLKVQAVETVPLTFARAVGINSSNVAASAVALSSGLSGQDWGTGEGCLFATDQGFALSCNNFNVAGSVFSNSSISVNLNNVTIGNTLHAKTSVAMSGNNLNGNFRLEYGTNCNLSYNHAYVSEYVKTPQVDVTPPINYDPAKFESDFHINYRRTGDWNIDQRNYTASPGTYYVPGNLTIGANNTNLSDCTFIVGGSVTITTNNLQLGYHENYMCFYLLGGGSININTNNVSVNGDLYAPNGYINCSSNNIHRGWWVARRISVSCNNFELDGIPGRSSGGRELKLVE